MNQNGIAFYKPHAKQDAFHRAGDFKARAVFAGNRFGKSDLGAAEDVAQALGNRPWYKKDDVAYQCGIPARAQKILIITTDWDKVDEIFTGERGANPGKLWKLFPKGFVKSKRRNHSGAIDTIECENGSLIRFDTVKSFMQNPQGLESSDWDVIHVDEPCPEDMFKAAARGLVDRNGQYYFTLTALSEPWMYDHFFPDPNQAGDASNRFMCEGRRWAITGSMRDNPYLSEDAIAAFEATLTPEERDCRLNGIPLTLAGVIYKEFSYDRHVLKAVPQGWNSYTEPPYDWPIYLHIDPHPQTPHMVLFCAVSPFNQLFFFNEIFEHCSVERLSQLIHEKLDGRTVVQGRIDPLAYINDPITETNMAEEFARHGVFLEKATKALQQGILRTKAELKRPNRIYVCPDMARFLFEISHYHWDKDNKPCDKDDHAMECFYRQLLADPIYVALNENSPSVPDMVFAGADLTMKDLDFSD